MDKLDFLQSLDFSEYESKVILSMLRLNIATTREISFDSGVPQNKLYGVLDKLNSKGIIELIPEKLKKYKIINFKEIIDKKIKNKENNLKDLQKGAKNFKDIKEHDEKSMFSIIKGQRAIMNKLADNNSRAKKEILGVQRNWKVWGHGLREVKRACSRGVKFKFIGVINNETKKRAMEWKKAGAEIRAYNKKFGEYPFRFTVFDGKEARITTGKPEINEPENYITVWTKSKPFVNMLKKQFLDMWKECDKF